MRRTVQVQHGSLQDMGQRFIGAWNKAVKGTEIWARPDWKQDSAYDHLANSGLRKIAWEFLRRNVKYQSAWCEYAQEIKRRCESTPELLHYVEWILSPEHTEAEYAAIGTQEEINAMAIRFMDLEIYETDLGKWMSLGRHIGLQWGLESICNPATEYSFDQPRFIEVGGMIRWPSSYSLKELEKEFSKRYSLTESKWLVMQIDLSLPIEVLETSVMNHIKKERKYRIDQGRIEPVNKRALSKAVYVKYLRLLDAKHADISRKEIGEFLAASDENSEGQRDKRIREEIKAAERPCESEYRYLPLLEHARRRVKEK